MLPRWALGFPQSRWSYYPEARVREIVQYLRDDKIPADVIYLDIDYQDRNRPFTVDRTRFPHFEELIEDLLKQHFHAIAITDLHIANASKGEYARYDSGNLPDPVDKLDETNWRNAVMPKSWRTIMSLNSRRVGVTICSTLLAVMVVLVACKKSPSHETFATPDEAGDALLQAARSGDQNQVLAVFGPESKNVISSGDATQDKASTDAYVQAYGAMHRWRKMPDGAQLLLVGVDNFAFPIPLRKTSGGKWFFDAGAGEEEIVRRRIGRNELAVIDVCYAIADAQAQYHSQPRNGESTEQFAPKFLSDPGKQNGLYWESPQGQPPSPLGPQNEIEGSSATI